MLSNQGLFMRFDIDPTIEEFRAQTARWVADRLAPRRGD